jgi:hypothetical protein
MRYADTCEPEPAVVSSRFLAAGTRLPGGGLEDGTHTVLGDMHSCSINQNVYLRKHVTASLRQMSSNTFLFQYGKRASHKFKGTPSPHSKSIWFGLMIRRR